ncbi:MAG: peptide/nickel transport system permease protein [Chloroflexia bacterium]|jgi:peptide/nickel transport system permease protein|nr:peptide/nickel transport system permease protein [Chloroflexia bacterium]
MITYIIRRVLQSALFILFMWLLVYTVLVLLMPRGPKDNYEHMGNLDSFHLPGEMSKDDLRQLYKLDKPWPANFFLWLFDPSDTFKQDPNNIDGVLRKGIDINLLGLRLQGSGALTGNFGISERVLAGREVGEAIVERWDNTMWLVGVALVLAVLVAVPLGIIAAMTYRSAFDHMITFFSFAGFSIPPYAFGVILIIVLAVVPYYIHTFDGQTWMPFLPPGDVASIGRRADAMDRIYHLALPVTTLALPQIAYLSRHMRFAMLEVLRLEYIRTAWAKGLSGWSVMFKHAFRNALIPLITAVGLMVPLLISGAILVETVFAYPGLGQLFFRAVGGCLAPPEAYERLCSPFGEPGALLPMDFSLTLGLTLLMVGAVALANVLADIFYSYADPRINYSHKSQR